MPTDWGGLHNFQAAVRSRLDEIDEDISGEYADDIRALSGLSEEEIDALEPGTADVTAYRKLIAVVEAASRHNAQTEQLREQVVALGDLAVKIVTEKVPALAAKLDL